MALHRHGSDVDLFWEHDKTSFVMNNDAKKCGGGELRRGYRQVMHRMPQLPDREPRLHLYFRLAGGDELGRLKSALKEIPHSLHDASQKEAWLNVEGTYNINRTITALFNETSLQDSFLCSDMHDALAHEFYGHTITQQYYTPSA